MELFNERLTKEQQETLLWMIKNLNRNEFFLHKLEDFDDFDFDTDSVYNYMPYVATLFGQAPKDKEVNVIAKINQVIEKCNTVEGYKEKLYNLKAFSIWGNPDDNEDDDEYED